ncbi:hypothetical protein PPTG_21091 [Phytophthora nicotianae INRA-310]|uniref:Uncharacterized protein n=2 Tax=Phytophthora nicotianae TaxID=4792 RepID=W2R7Y1_PHYN3|nr:hypothetical protein PPTG_21091 [Phytophthora nicotianae INRA-310]ETM44941.1 hypothetical protein L914_09872 [Phytophthora nicotianae]ETN21512.1 hypothetical protein PPTG_21091 [Phytophthora nicotianae INRA-310]
MCFLTITHECAREVSTYRDKNGINYSRKAIDVAFHLILTVVEPKATLPHLQETIQKYPNEFDSKAVIAVSVDSDTNNN